MKHSTEGLYLSAVSITVSMLLAVFIATSDSIGVYTKVVVAALAVLLAVSGGAVLALALDEREDGL